jgi:hypothetical protein
MLPGPEALIFRVQDRQAARDRSVKILFEQTKMTVAAAGAKNVWEKTKLDFRDQHRHESENAPPWRPKILPQAERLIAEGKAVVSFAPSGL